MRIAEGFYEEELPVNAVIALGPPEKAAALLGVRIPDSLSNAVFKRQYEFIAGRACAARALKKAGFAGKADMPIGQDRAPAWPAGYSGSIAHSEGLAWAVAAPKAAARGVGIDLETLIKPETATEISERILLPSERGEERRRGLSFENYLSLVFSAKESLYKCLAPLAGVFFGFEDAETVSIDPDKSELVLVLRKDLNDEFKTDMKISARFEFSETGVRTFVVYAGRSLLQ